MSETTKRSAGPEDFHVFTNMAISMDGKIATRERRHIDPHPYDAFMMDKIRSRADAVLTGAATLRAFQRPATVLHKRFQLMRRARRKNRHPINVVIAKTIDFDPSWPFFSASDIERVLVVPEGTPESTLKPFQTLAHVFQYEKSPDVPEQIISYPRKLGCRNLLIEGGGGIMFPWVERDLIDEWNVTLVPVIIGGVDAPTMVEGEGFDVDSIKKYRLRRVKRRGGQIFLNFIRP